MKSLKHLDMSRPELRTCHWHAMVDPLPHLLFNTDGDNHTVIKCAKHPLLVRQCGKQNPSVPKHKWQRTELSNTRLGP